MTLLSLKETKNLLLEEYPFLDGYNLKVVKQFAAPDGRTYNTFRVESDHPQYKKFIAKRPWGEETPSFVLEWAVLKMLLTHDVDAPKLLLPEHKPQNFMLLELIEGQKASEAIEHGNVDEVFYEVGVSTGKFHTIPAPGFGELLENENTNWAEYLENKLLERAKGCNKLIQQNTYDQVIHLIHELRPVMVSESQGQPVLIHRDIYLENFIMRPATNQAVLIDYAMVKGGRPFYDLAKFFILDLYNHPEQQDSFLKGYQKYVPIPSDFNERMRLYLLKESLGMIYFFHSIDKPQYRDHAIKCLEELTNNHGIIHNLLK